MSETSENRSLLGTFNKLRKALDAGREKVALKILHTEAGRAAAAAEKSELFPHWTALHWAAGKCMFSVVDHILRIKEADSFVSEADGFGKTPLHLAAAFGGTKTVALLVGTEKGRDTIEAKEHEEGWTPLHEAARLGREDVVLKLLETREGRRAVYAEDAGGQLAEDLAKINGHSEIADILRECRVGPTSPQSGKLTEEPSAGERGRVAKDLFNAVQDDDLPLMRKILLSEHGNWAASQTHGSTSQTPLHEAAERGHREAAQLLLLALEGRSSLESKDTCERTPMYLAAKNGHCDLVNMFLLVDIGAKTLGEKSLDGTLPIHAASRWGHPNVVKAIARVAEGRDTVSLKDNTGCSPLHCASANGHDAVVRRLLNVKGAKECIAEKDKDGRTPLHLAAVNNHLVVVARLLQTKGSGDAENAKDNSGMTPLHLAAKEGHFELADMLLEGGEQSLEKDKKGNTPLHLAAEKGHREVADLLLKTEAQRKVLSKRNNSGLTPLHLASSDGHTAIVKLFLMAREGRAAMKLGDNLDRTPRDLADKYDHERIVDMFDVCSASFGSVSEDALTCGVCYETFSSSDELRRPIVACSNGHSMCSDCVRRNNGMGGTGGICPTCRQHMLWPPVVNRALCEVIEAVKKAEQN